MARPVCSSGMTIDDVRARQIQRSVVLVLAAYVLLMLFAGLRPYQRYADHWVSFDADGQRTVFGHHGLLAGDLDPRLGAALERSAFEVSLDVRLLEPPDGRFQVLVQIDAPGSDDPLIIGQWRSSLIVMSGRDYRNEHGLPRFSSGLSDRLGEFVEIVVTLSSGFSRLSVDSTLLATGPIISFHEPPTRISVGNAPDGSHGWTGDLRRLRLRSTLPESVVVRYDFETDPAPTIVDTETGLHPLHVPLPGHFPDSAGIGRMRLRDLLGRHRQDIAVNLAGFMPFGALLCTLSLLGHARRNARQARKRRTAATVGVAATSRRRAAFVIFAVTLLGFLASLGIESLQIHIAGRSAHAHDMLLNTLGAGLGALSACLLSLMLSVRIGVPQEHSPDERPTS